MHAQGPFGLHMAFSVYYYYFFFLHSLPLRPTKHMVAHNNITRIEDVGATTMTTTSFSSPPLPPVVAHIWSTGRKIAFSLRVGGFTTTCSFRAGRNVTDLPVLMEIVPRYTIQTNAYKTFRYLGTYSRDRLRLGYWVNQNVIMYKYFGVLCLSSYLCGY